MSKSKSPVHAESLPLRTVTPSYCWMFKHGRHQSLSAPSMSRARGLKGTATHSNDDCFRLMYLARSSDSEEVTFFFEFFYSFILRKIGVSNRLTCSIKRLLNSSPVKLVNPGTSRIFFLSDKEWAVKSPLVRNQSFGL